MRLLVNVWYASQNIHKDKAKQNIMNIYIYIYNIFRNKEYAIKYGIKIRKKVSAVNSQKHMD